jgi:hypothetical protein
MGVQDGPDFFGYHDRTIYGRRVRWSTACRFAI